MSSPTTGLHGVSNNHVRKRELSHEARVSRRIPSPFVYATTPAPTNLRENMSREEQLNSRLDNVQKASRIIRPISLASLRKVPGSHPFEPGELPSHRVSHTRRNSLSARHFTRETNVGSREDYRKDELIRDKFSCYIQPNRIKSSNEFREYLYFPGRCNTSRGDNPFMYRSGSQKSGINYQEKNWNKVSDSIGRRSVSSATHQHQVSPAHPMESQYLQHQLKLLSRPKLLPNFEAKLVTNKKQNSLLNNGKKYDPLKEVSAKDTSLFDPLDIDFKVNSTPRKPKDFHSSHRISLFRDSDKKDTRLIFAEEKELIPKKFEKVKEENDKTYHDKKQVMDTLQASNTPSFERLSAMNRHDNKQRARISSDGQVYYTVSVKNPTAQTVVLLRNQTNAYLRSAISTKLLNYEQTKDQTGTESINRVLLVPSSVIMSAPNQTVESRTQTVTSSMTVTIQKHTTSSIEDSCTEKSTSAEQSIVGALVTTTRVFVCGTAKHVEMDSGNGTDEDDNLTRELDEPIEKVKLYRSDKTVDEDADADVDADADADVVDEVEDEQSDEDDEASDSSGVIESDEEANNPLSETDTVSTNEEVMIVASPSAAKTSIRTRQPTAGDGCSMMLDSKQTESTKDQVNTLRTTLPHHSSHLIEPKSVASTGTDIQTGTYQLSHSETHFKESRSASPFTSQINRFGPFISRSVSKTPLVPTPRSIGLVDADKKMESPQPNRPRVDTPSNVPYSLEGAKLDRTSTMEISTAPTKTPETDKSLTASLELKQISRRSEDVPSKSDTHACYEPLARSPPLVVKEPTKKTRRHTITRHLTGGSTTHPALISSLFPKVPPVLRFVDEGYKLESLPWEFRRLLRWRASMLTPAVVKQALLRSGFRVSKLTSATEDLETIESSDWVFYFGKHMRPQVFRSIKEYQKVNHLPCSFQLGRKDRLWKNLVHMQMRCGKENFNYMPQTFCLPGDLEALKKVWDEEGASQRWILKPPASARGIGVRLITKWAQVPKKRPAIVQKYLARPFLINESKFDLRIYVYISSINPLRVYIHEDGLVRFASQKYTNSTRCLGNRFIHLTNYSINRLNSEYVSNTNEQAAKGHKWSLRALWAYLRSQGISPAPVWSSIKDVVVKTAISTEAAFNAAVSSYCNHSCSVHEVFGFDIFLDEDLQPWLLEVNVSPSMHSDSPLDAKIKGNMVRDMLNIAGLQLPEPSDTNSHTVIPSCLSKAPSARHSSTDVVGPAGGSQRPSPQVVLDPNAVVITPLVTAPESDSGTRTQEQRLKSAGDGERPSPHPNRLPKKIRSPSHEWVIDSRLHMTYLSADEREKRRYYVLRALQYELPKSCLCTPVNGMASTTFSTTPGSIESSLGMGNNNFQDSPNSLSCTTCLIPYRATGSQSSASNTVSSGSTPTDSGSGASNAFGMIQTFSSQSNRSTPTSGTSAPDEEDEVTMSSTPDLPEPSLFGNANNTGKKSARSMGIGPSSPDLRSHRFPNSTVLGASNKELPAKPPTAPPLSRSKVTSKQSSEATGMRTTPNTPNFRLRNRSSLNSGVQSSVRPQTLPRVRLASATADILECLTPSDVRILIGMVDELERAGGFECIFPPTTAGLAVRYLSYFETPRYSNLLCIAYLQKYGEDKEKGIEMLRKHCEKNIHLISTMQGDHVPVENQWQKYMKRKALNSKDHSQKIATPSPVQRGRTSANSTS